jgi:hypothetical protein
MASTRRDMISLLMVVPQTLLRIRVRGKGRRQCRKWELSFLNQQISPSYNDQRQLSDVSQLVLEVVLPVLALP